MPCAAHANGRPSTETFNHDIMQIHILGHFVARASVIVRSAGSSGCAIHHLKSVSIGPDAPRQGFEFMRRPIDPREAILFTLILILNF